MSYEKLHIKYRIDVPNQDEKNEEHNFSKKYEFESENITSIYLPELFLKKMFFCKLFGSVSLKNYILKEEKKTKQNKWIKHKKL